MHWLFYYGVLLIQLGVPVWSKYYDCRRVGSRCANGGICTKTRPECFCRPVDVFVGHDCALKVDDVMLNQEYCSPRCQNGGVCKTSTSGFFTCYCSSAFFGNDCSKRRGEVRCAGDRMAVEVTPFPPFNGVVFVKGHEFNPNCRITKVFNTYTGIFSFKGPCSVQELLNRPYAGDTTFELEIVLLHSALIETKFDMVLKAQCVHSGAGSTGLTGGMESVKPNPDGTSITEEKATSTYQPVQFELQTASGAPIIPPVHIGNAVRLYFPLSDTGKYKKIFIVDCNALNGLTGNRLRSLTLVKNGCTTDEGRNVVIGDVVYDLLEPAVIVNFKVFKFVDSNRLSFQCNIRVCTEFETECDPPLFCPPANSVARRKRGTSRRKRGASTTKIHVARNITLTSVDIEVIDPMLELNRLERQKTDLDVVGTEMCFGSSDILLLVCVFFVFLILCVSVLLCLTVRILRTKKSNNKIKEMDKYVEQPSEKTDTIVD